MKKSQRGSIRKAPSAISWVVSLTNMASSMKNVDMQAVIKQWILGKRIVNMVGLLHDQNPVCSNYLSP